MTNHYEAAREAHRRATPNESWAWDEPDNFHGIYARIHPVGSGDKIATTDLAGWGKKKGRAICESIVTKHNAWPAVEEVVAAAIELRAAIANASVKVDGFEPRIFVGEEKGAVILAADAKLREALGRLTGEGVR
jgi:hypothetical protein